MPSKDYKPTVSRKQLLDLSKRVTRAKSIRGVIRILQNFKAMLPDDGRGSWYYYCDRLIAGFRCDEYAFQIIKLEGNTKLPFAAFSTLPIVTCPGMGDCENWCYSLRAWRYPAAFFRQLQNTVLLRFKPEAIEKAFLKLAHGIEFRLYVDGDFDSVDTVRFWMRLLAQRSDINAYGYSKSWAQLLEYHQNGFEWPENYALNLSSGSKFESLPGWRDAMLRLPITRGEFVAVKIDDTDLPRGFARYESREYHKRVREALLSEYGTRSVSCPGQCGTCGTNQHMCGNKTKLHNITIGIGVH